MTASSICRSRVWRVLSRASCILKFLWGCGRYLQACHCYSTTSFPQILTAFTCNAFVRHNGFAAHMIAIRAYHDPWPLSSFCTAYTLHSKMISPVALWSTRTTGSILVTTRLLYLTLLHLGRPLTPKATCCLWNADNNLVLSCQLQVRWKTSANKAAYDPFRASSSHGQLITFSTPTRLGILMACVNRHARPRLVVWGELATLTSV